MKNKRKLNILTFLSILFLLDKKHITEIIKELKKIPSKYDNQVIRGGISELKILNLEISIIDIKRTLIIYHKINKA